MQKTFSNKPKFLSYFINVCKSFAFTNDLCISVISFSTLPHVVRLPFTIYFFAMSIFAFWLLIYNFGIDPAYEIDTKCLNETKAEFINSICSFENYFGSLLKFLVMLIVCFYSKNFISSLVFSALYIVLFQTIAFSINILNLLGNISGMSEDAISVLNFALQIIFTFSVLIFNKSLTFNI